MLKSTHKPGPAPPPLPEGWAEYKAPTGHPYYYNSSTKESTYTRPSQPQQSTTQKQSGSGIPQTLPSNGYGKAPPGGLNAGPPGLGPPSNHHFMRENSDRGRGGRGGRQDYHERPERKDRPKTKNTIPGCEPWLLVKTKLGRRFVYNPDECESLWKFPPDVMKGVVDYDRIEREKRERIGKGKDGRAGDAEPAAAETERLAAGEIVVPPAALAPAPSAPEREQKLLDSDGEEYEEVEVTDDEDEENPSKRQKTEEGNAEQQVEFNEDDIAYQLTAMGHDYGLDPAEYGDGEGQVFEEGAEGLSLTADDSSALFKDMLDDYRISPYTTWEKLIEEGRIVEDDRYTVIANMRSRKEVWDQWSRDRIQSLWEQREKEEKKDPRIPYFAFLQSHATPKLYWPEFRRNYKKEAEMRDNKLSDKDREKWYREYINRLKLPESTLKSDLVKLLKSVPLHALNRSTYPELLPPNFLTDLCYFSLRPSIRDPLIEAHISSLPPAPTGLEISPEEEAVHAKEKQERERREKALEERQWQVQEERRRQRGELHHSKGMLREGEEEVERAMRVGKDGLLGYREGHERRELAPREMSGSEDG